MLGKDAALIKHLKLLIWITLVQCAIKAQLRSARTLAFPALYNVTSEPVNVNFECTFSYL